MCERNARVCARVRENEKEEKNAGEGEEEKGPPYYTHTRVWSSSGDTIVRTRRTFLVCFMSFSGVFFFCFFFSFPSTLPARLCFTYDPLPPIVRIFFFAVFFPFFFFFSRAIVFFAFFFLCRTRVPSSCLPCYATLRANSSSR